jgi:hypothetical protein
LEEHGVKDDDPRAYIIQALQDGISHLLAQQQIEVSKLTGIGPFEATAKVCPDDANLGSITIWP